MYPFHLLRTYHKSSHLLMTALEIIKTYRTEDEAPEHAHAFNFKLRENVKKDMILKRLVSENYEINDFHVVEPTLEQIFVDKAGDSI